MNVIKGVNSPLYRAWKWLQSEDAMDFPAPYRLSHLLLTYGGSYRPGDPEVLKIAGVQVSCTGGTHNLLNAWAAKARVILEGAARAKARLEGGA